MKRVLLAILIMLFIATNAFALTLKVKVITNDPEEIFISVNNFKKITSGHEATFDIEKGFVEVEVKNKRVTKFVNKDSFLVIKLKE